MIHRLIANLLIRNGAVVQTNKFEPTNFVGRPSTAVDIFNSWALMKFVFLKYQKIIVILTNL